MAKLKMSKPKKEYTSAELQAIDAEIAELNKQASDTYKAISERQRLRAEAAVSVIKEHDAFRQSVWSLDHNAAVNGSARLVAFTKNFGDLLKGSNCYNQPVESGVNLSLGHDTINLDFEDVDTMLAFISNHRLTISMKATENRVKEKFAEFSNMQKLIDSIRGNILPGVSCAD